MPFDSSFLVLKIAYFYIFGLDLFSGSKKGTAENVKIVLSLLSLMFLQMRAPELHFSVALFVIE